MRNQTLNRTNLARRALLLMLDVSRFTLGLACCTRMICAKHAQLSVFYRLLNSKRFILICSALDFYRFLSFRCMQLFGCKRATKGQTDVRTKRRRWRQIYRQTDKHIKIYVFFTSFVLQSMKPFYFVYLTFRREGCALSMDFLFILLLSDTVS